MSGNVLLPNVVGRPMPPPGGTRLIYLANDVQELTERHETDVRTAMQRGLAEYVEQLQADWMGRILRFAKVVQSWAEPEDPGVYPGACVFGITPGEFADYEERFAPSYRQVASGATIAIGADYQAELVLDCWFLNPQDRVGFMSMLEDAADPVDWMSGFRLELPHYHNARLELLMMASQYLDDTTSAQQRRRRSQLVFRARLPKIRVVGRLPVGSVRANGSVGADVKLG